ncbi:unnamed protein product [Clonostachys rosea]|uniref:Uncharacterized protein n=1 Tax=Bionectria ochroleuca TaxID=29856 RepID=A0ABY6U6C4_BIOOC|nr:unnamed protein product [Clonostachys rosea]
MRKLARTWKRVYITYRYLEEALKNMTGLEIVELWGITSVMARNIAVLENLKALSLTTEKVKNREDISALREVKNLQHFKLQSWLTVSREFDEIIQTILLNSRSTLRSLVIKNLSHKTNGLRFGFLDDWRAELGSGSQTPHFPALRSLQLIGLEKHDEGLARVFEKAVDFMSLRTLHLERIRDGRTAVYRYLGDLAARTPKEDIKLRSFKMDNYSSNATSVERRDDMETICRFLSSFDSLTNLHVLDYNDYLAEGEDAEALNVERVLPDPLHRAILNHKNLTKLALYCEEFDYRIPKPYLSLEVIASLVDGLPMLEEFEFTARPSDMVRVGQALARGKKLTTISVSTVGEKVPPIELVTNLLRGILDTGDRGSGDDRPFRWENHSNLRRVIAYRKWALDIASWFVAMEGEGRAHKPLKVQGFRNTKREVLFRDVSRLLHGKDSQSIPNCDWAEDVARDMI